MTDTSQSSPHPDYIWAWDVLRDAIRPDRLPADVVQPENIPAPPVDQSLTDGANGDV